MTPHLKYDFSELTGIAARILYDENVTPATLRDLRSELNRFFADSTCLDVLYTKNDDKLFFGMYVIPNINGSMAVDIMMGDEPLRIQQYYLEIDSKLTNPALGITPEELVAFILHEVGHMVNDSQPVGKLRRGVDEYFATNRESLKISDSDHYREILAFGLKNTAQKITSIFEKDSNELLADEFVYSYGYGDRLQSGFEKIVKNGYNVNSNMANKFAVMVWTLQLYKDVAHKRIPALKTLNKSKAMSGSKLEIKEIEGVIRRINRIDDSALMENSISSAVKSKMKRMKYDSLRGLEDDFYEFNMRIRNVEDEEDALYLMRQINTRIAIIEEYIGSGNDLTASELRRWSGTIDKFKKLRDQLSKMTVYRARSFGLYVNYPDIQKDRY